MMTENKAEKATAPKITMDELSKYVNVRETTPSFEQIFGCTARGYDSIATFSDQSIGTTLKYSNPSMPSIVMGFILDKKWDEIARYERKRGQRLISAKEYEYIVKRRTENDGQNTNANVMLKGHDVGNGNARGASPGSPKTAADKARKEIEETLEKAKNYARFMEKEVSQIRALEK
jgi:hypothetical protein